MDKIEKVSVNGQVYELAGSGGGSGTPVNITYSELVALKNRNSLVAGTRYRITDYTAVFKTLKSASHQFDIVVEALSESILSEKASAMQHEGDEYFAASKMELWEIWYSLENDTARFSEAAENGKGFIYKLKDEYGNDVCFDFKNALFTLTSEEYPFITTSNGSMDFYLFSYNTGTGNDISNQETIADRSVLYPTTVMNNTVSFDLTSKSFCIVFLLDKYILSTLEIVRKISGNTILSTTVVIPINKLSTFTESLNIPSSVSVRVKNWCSMKNVTISEPITIEGTGEYISLSECRILNINKLIVKTSSTISNVDIESSGRNDGTLVIQEPLSACIVRVDYYDAGLTYTLPESEDGMGFRSKLIWGRSGDSDEPTIKVIDPFDLVN